MSSSVSVFALTSLLLAVTAGTASAQPDRGGFTFLVNMGVGVQSDSAVEETAVGLGGLNVGAGGFVTPRLAILGRVSGTFVSYDLFDQSSAVIGPTIQFWPNNRLSVEAGAGVGSWRAEDVTERGLGLILGMGVSVFQRGKHNLAVGIEYAPVFTDDPVHNFGFTFGYQLF